MANGKLRHIAISVPDKESAAKFYEETFGFERVSESRVATRLSDGVMNITLLQFETQEDAGDEHGRDFVGLHHFGIWVDDIDTMKHAIETHGGEIPPRSDRTRAGERGTQIPRPKRHRVRYLDLRLGRCQALIGQTQSVSHGGIQFGKLLVRKVNLDYPSITFFHLL